MSRTALLVPLLIVAIGIGWLLTALSIGPAVDWIWTIGLAAVGLAVFVPRGIDKFSVVFGPWLILASFLSLLRHADYLSLNLELPILVIALGGLMVVALHPAIPRSTWLHPASQPQPVDSNEPKKVRLTR